VERARNDLYQERDGKYQEIVQRCHTDRDFAVQPRCFELDPGKPFSIVLSERLVNDTARDLVYPAYNARTGQADARWASAKEKLDQAKDRLRVCDEALADAVKVVEKALRRVEAAKEACR